MDETAFKAALAEELPLVHRALLRRFPTSRLRQADVEEAALHTLAKSRVRGQLLPVAREEIFAWLFGLGFRRHILALIVRVRERVREGLIGLCRKLGVDIEEVLQDAWLRAQQAVERRGEDGPFPLTEEDARNWFWRVASNTAHDLRRALNRRQMGELSPHHPAPAASQADDLEVQGLARALEALPAMERRVVELSVEGLKSVAIAEQLGLPVEQVYYFKRRALLHLRLSLGEGSSEVARS